MDASFTAEQGAHKSRGLPAQIARIDQWVAQQLAEPWPLNSAQLDLIRRVLAAERISAAKNSRGPTAIHADGIGGAA
jgi:hypothetical protein